MEKQITALEKRIAKLEKAATLFEEHRQAWIGLNKNLKKLKREMDRDDKKLKKRAPGLTSQIAMSKTGRGSGA